MNISRLLGPFYRVFPKIRTIFYVQYNKLYFRANGINYGRRMQVYNKVYILGQGNVRIGDDFRFTSGDCINSICRNIRGTIHTMSPSAQIQIGDSVGISSVCIRCKESITIGNNVNIGGDCLIMDNDSHPQGYMQRRRDYEQNNGTEEYFKLILSAPIVIEDDVWIGARCQILKGVHIGSRSIIASGSIVTKDIPKDCVAGGNPAKVIRFLENDARLS